MSFLLAQGARAPADRIIYARDESQAGLFITDIGNIINEHIVYSIAYTHICIHTFMHMQKYEGGYVGGNQAWRLTSVGKFCLTVTVSSRKS